MQIIHYQKLLLIVLHWLIKTLLKFQQFKVFGWMLKYNFIFGILKEHFKKRFADNTLSKIIIYNSTLANKDFSFINIEFYLSLNN